MNPAQDLLYPLNLFYARAGADMPVACEIEPDEIPEPYRQLLVHRNDMTPTLEGFHGGPIHLRLLGRRLDGEILSREVVLVLNGSEKPVEFGAIVINLEHFPAAARGVIMECRRPLGTIMADYDIERASQPRAFLRVKSDHLMEDALNLDSPCDLYGRRNVLIGKGGVNLAHIVEILPP